MASAVETECRNSITSAHEVYEWLHNPPAKYFAYVKLTTDRQGYGAGILTTWTGEKLGNLHAGRRYRSGFGYDTYRRSISVVGTNGVKYYGTYYESSGDYARITARKHQ